MRRSRGELTERRDYGRNENKRQGKWALGRTSGECLSVTNSAWLRVSWFGLIQMSLMSCLAVGGGGGWVKDTTTAAVIMNNKECNKASSSTQSNVSFVKLRRTLFLDKFATRERPIRTFRQMIVIISWGLDTAVYYSCWLMDWVHPKARDRLYPSGQMDGWWLTEKYRIDVSTQRQKYFLGSFLSVHHSRSESRRMRQSGVRWHWLSGFVTCAVCINPRVGEILCTYTVIQVSLTRRQLISRRSWASRLILTWNERKKE